MSITDENAPAPTKRKTGYIKLTTAKAVPMGILLAQHCHKDPDNPGLCYYDEGWNDERVAKEIDPLFTAVHTAGLRLQLYGKLRTSAALKSVEAETINELRETVRALASDLEVHRAYFNKLVDHLLGADSKFRLEPIQMEVKPPVNGSLL